MHALAVALPLVLIAAAFVLGLWLRRGGLNEYAARRRPENVERSAWPTGWYGWLLTLLMLAVLALVIDVSVHQRGWVSATTTFVIVSAGTVVVSRWMRGSHANW